MKKTVKKCAKLRRQEFNTQVSVGLGRSVNRTLNTKYVKGPSKKESDPQGYCWEKVTYYESQINK